ncbi:CDHR2 protein, partial [Amia calva]|nr:CDHR2 protein [Amia calva]
LGDYAFKICAIDPENRALTYRISGVNAMYFTVNPDTGDVTLKSLLDREVSVTGYKLASKELFIIVEDANDNRPIFNPATYDEKFPENTPVGTVLFTVSATDKDQQLAAVVNYSIEQVVPNDPDLFEIARTGEVRLTAPFNYTSKSTFYQLKITAKDGGGQLDGEEVFQNSSTFAFIAVVDVPDIDPQFLNVVFQTSVNEHAAVDTSVFHVKAIDGDRGINDNIIFSIQNTNAPGFFRIDSSSGVIFVNEIIDRESLLDMHTVVNLTVMAEEKNLNIHGNKATATENVIINIVDINDNKPVFYNCTESDSDCISEVNSFTGDITEHSSRGVPVENMHILVRDLDMGNHAKFNFCLKGEDKDAFTVSPTTAMQQAAVQILVKSSNSVDYEKKTTMKVQIVVCDAAFADFCSTATVTIAVKDINDNSPEFAKETYYLDVKEDTKNGTMLATITATDPDTEDKNQITYKLLPERMLQYFEVGKTNGTIYVKNYQLLDREKIDNLAPTLQATDYANNTGTTVLEISIIDINDNPPKITRDAYIDYVKEGSDLHLSIQAVDDDKPDTNNSAIRYRIEPSEYSNNFTINSNTGMLENKGPLDREHIKPSLNGAIHLIVTAYDLGTPSLSSLVNVTINVEDINDNGPIFTSSKYTFYVNESESDAHVGNVSASDSDQMENYNRISFSILDGGFRSFIIRTFQENTTVFGGSISVDPDTELDYETVKNLYVLDVNDEPPQFTPQDLQPLNVKENTTGLGVLRKIKGTDMDTKHSLVYELLSVSCNCVNFMLEACEKSWFILMPNGEVIVNDKSVIDYEMCHEATMTIQVVDEFTQKGKNHSSPGTLKINIMDINDNVPEFIPAGTLFVVVPELAARQSEVAKVSATDRDSGVNRAITFRVVKSEFIHDVSGRPQDMAGYFEAETTADKDNMIYTGSIKTTKTLDINLKGRYFITVEAKDQGAPSHSTTIKLDVGDFSFRVQLEFKSTVTDMKVNEDTIKRTLMSATGATVHIVDILDKTKDVRNSGYAVLVAYFVYQNGTAISPKDIIVICLEQPSSQTEQLSKNGVGETVTEVDPMFYGLAGLAAGFIILLIIMITSLVCTQKSYKRKLKAANAMKSTAFIGTNNHHSGQVVPGTNKYNMEGANPVLNLNIDTATDLGFDEEGSNADRVR